MGGCPDKIDKLNATEKETVMANTLAEAAKRAACRDICDLS